MPGQLSATGAQALANVIGGIVPPALVDGMAGAPAWVPGLTVIDYSASPPQPYYWDGTGWAAGVQPLYVALLTGDPTVSSPDGGYAQGVADLTEDATAGYQRQPVTFAEPAGAGYPATISSTAALTFGPYTAAQLQSVQWAALVTSSSGTTGLLLYLWTLPAPQQVSASQSIQIAAGDLMLSQS